MPTKNQAFILVDDQPSPPSRSDNSSYEKPSAPHNHNEPGIPMPMDTKKIFVVHGHEVGLRAIVARFLEQLGAKPVILSEEASGGRTVIENFEMHADVAYAVVLMTGDDRGGAKDTPPRQFKKRARQNVIFELGYFMSKLKRNKVCILYEQDVEIPSDITGVIYVPYDASSDGWQIKMARELKKAELDIDLNRWLGS
jgi:predicted nucleotide-binding protein